MTLSCMVSSDSRSGIAAPGVSRRIRSENDARRGRSWKLTNLLKREARKLIEERSDDALLLFLPSGGGDTNSSGDVMPDVIIYRPSDKEV